ncbi:NADH-ubiquinone oxidoreductase-F iron-sulfur binding region domain-containing protein [Nocardia jiangxiensis]|uniref:NADH-ubiquinone oxidoreductase-F iron-sulfur binding region domain-containing protein n=1 Tax=Nocardia jiangxiensis TaxID=282685 RepID=A0ABW6SEY7_9NOCA|nr:NADH-ubiquinone oxidoreductase-F iron-sulfur binding region domain-containing protein [Nocardia jiangxiensis]
MTSPVRSALYPAPATATPARVVGATPARLVLPGVEDAQWGLGHERALGFFGPAVEPAAFLADLAQSGLRGRGGAGFPAHHKWTAVAAAPESVVVANGHEGEPASAKDRWLLTRRPHLVLDGLLLAARVTGSSEAIVYASDPEALTSVRQAVADVTAAGLVPHGVTLRVHAAPHGYVAGEESAVVQSINGRPAKPTSKPPRPFEVGVRGLPTLVSNVETLAHAAWIRRFGAAEFAQVGSAASRGTALFTITGPVAEPGVYEMSLGSTVSDLIAAAGGMRAPMRGALIGGWFNGVAVGDHGGLVCCYDAMREAGTGLGCAAITVLGPDDDILAVAGELSGWFQGESALQCGSCLSGTKAIARAFREVLRGDDTTPHLANLTRWGSTLSGRGACGLIDGAATLARTGAEELARRNPRKES